MGDWEREPLKQPRADNQYPLNEWEHSQKAVRARRLAEEKAHYERGFPVAGHDFAREARERNSLGLER